MAHLNLTGFGDEFDTYKYENGLDWFVRYNDWYNLWKAQPTYMISQIVYLAGAIVTFLHAQSKGGRWPYLWLATIFHGIVVEVMGCFLPDIDSYWQSQTPIIFLGGRFPLHIITLYPNFIYHASYAISRLRLPKWAEPFAVGLTVVMIDIPYDVVAVRFLHWTWHDTDPNIFDRFYWVPWNSFYFHATFAASFTLWFHLFPKLFGKKNDKWESSGCFKEFLVSMLTGLFGMPGGVLLFLPIYHPLHDFAKIHSEVTFFILFTVFLTIAWSGDRTVRERVVQKLTGFDYVMLFHLFCHYFIYLSFCIWWNPEDEVSIGLHEPIGPCDKYLPVHTVYGELQKREFLCVKDYDEGYFDFHCLPGGKPPKNGSVWYTTCGTPFKNRTEYIAILSTIFYLATIMFYNHYIRTSKGEVSCKKKKSKKE